MRNSVDEAIVFARMVMGIIFAVFASAIVFDVLKNFGWLYYGYGVSVLIVFIPTLLWWIIPKFKEKTLKWTEVIVWLALVFIPVVNLTSIFFTIFRLLAMGVKKACTRLYRLVDRPVRHP